MMRRTFPALLALLVSCFLVSHVRATTFLGPLISRVDCDKARYLPGATATCTATLVNNTGALFTGNVQFTGILNNQTMFTFPYTVNLAAGQTAGTTYTFVPPTNNYRGYYIKVLATNGSGTTVDQASGYLEVASTTRRFPRQSFNTRFDNATHLNVIDPTGPIADEYASALNLKQHGIDIMQVGALYRPEYDYNPALPCWNELEQFPSCAAQVTALVSYGHAFNMEAIWYAPYNLTGVPFNASLDPPGNLPTPSMMAYDDTCGLTNSCSATADADVSPLRGGWWNTNLGYNWVYDYFIAMNSCDARWRKQRIVGATGAVSAFNLDGWFIDTGSSPGPEWDIYGNPLQPATCLSQYARDFTQANPGKYALANTSIGFSAPDVELTGHVWFSYYEIWGYGIDSFLSYTDVDNLVNGSPGIKHYNQYGVNQDMFPDRTLYNNCSGHENTCNIGTAGALMHWANMDMIGSYPVNLDDDNECPNGNDGFNFPQLNCTAAFKAAFLDEIDWGIGHENFTKDGVSRDTLGISITSGGVGGTSGAAGQVYIRNRTKTGFQIATFLNETGETDNYWTDLLGTKPQPTALSNVGVKLYFRGAVTSSSSLLVCSAPDVLHGADYGVAFTKGSDGGGNYITFTLPNLYIAAICILQTDGVVDTQFSFDPTVEAFLGTNFNECSPGISTDSTVATEGGHGRWCKYENFKFPATSPGHVNYVYSAPGTGNVRATLDTSDGVEIMNCTLPASPTTSTLTCPLERSVPAGLHSLYLHWDGEQISTYGAQFVP